MGSKENIYPADEVSDVEANAYIKNHFDLGEMLDDLINKVEKLDSTITNLEEEIQYMKYKNDALECEIEKLDSMFNRLDAEVYYMKYKGVHNGN